MDDIREIENRMREAGAFDVVAPSDQLSPTDLAQGQNPAPISVALDEVAANIVNKAQERVKSNRFAEKYSRALERNASDRISNEIERQKVENDRKKADNVIDRKELANKLYKIKEESRRLKKEQLHLSQMQKQEQRDARKKAYWESHKSSLEQYKMHEGSSRIACEIILWLDGIKGFFNGLSKVSDSIVKALKWIFVVGAIAGVLMAIPATREWLLTIMGFIK